jgi:hypothetical protein
MYFLPCRLASDSAALFYFLLNFGLPFAESEQGIFEHVLKGNLDFSSDL